MHSRGLIDMTGQRRGKLLVLRRAPPTPQANGLWICLCDCGRLVAIRGGQIRKSGYPMCVECYKASRRAPLDPALESRREKGREQERNRSRSARKREQRAITLSPSRTTKRERRRIRNETAAIIAEIGDYERPQTRGDCLRVPRPCPFVSCRYNLYLDIAPRTGSLKLNFPDINPGEMAESCVLDIADRSGATLEDVGAAMNLTRERVRQLEVKALRKLESGASPTLRELADAVAEQQTRRDPGVWREAIGGGE